MSGKLRRMIRLIWPQYLVEPPDVEGTTKKDRTLYCNPLVSGRRVKDLDKDLGDGSPIAAPGSISFCERRWANSSER